MRFNYGGRLCSVPILITKTNTLIDSIRHNFARMSTLDDKSLSPAIRIVVHGPRDRPLELGYQVNNTLLHNRLASFINVAQLTRQETNNVRQRNAMM
jgi:hypothetical protein